MVVSGSAIAVYFMHLRERTWGNAVPFAGISVSGFNYVSKKVQEYSKIYLATIKVRVGK